MTTHTYTAADFANLDPDALKALGVTAATHPGTGIVDLYFLDFEGEQACYSAMQLDHAAAQLGGVASARCWQFLVGSNDDGTYLAEAWTRSTHFSSGPRPSPLAAALAAYGELVRSEKGAGDA